ncbi:o-succinylbenzoate--CoA ligase [Corynebacterium guangdongense]|uniref:O-succinylbenzoic acid--CoA ligase n=1 Tax=Corynebacterium guangdongense TaxID=1783348 RepID=A0ABU1ZU43_9CORY|nr:o-succinylbenzoate--CoA ligase [Corynebacterium guangdongense]MDR7328454.1 O-succinylbenzoic acid--CoA ligase [Corynebacterium guangdongense]WJZ17031.1 2-succinylbenzoate--CoA ligase [Corynebacterium guangdongense]
MNRPLELLPVDPHHPTAILGDLEEAIAGQRSLLPVPAHDAARRELLRATLAPGTPVDEDTALVVATSGSTGPPKGALLSPVNLVSSADATHRFLGGAGQWLLAMPAHHIAGLQVLVRSLVAGVDPLAIDVSAGFSVPAFAAASRELAETGDRVYTSLTPHQLGKAMDSLEGIEALRLFDAVLVGGAAINPTLLAAARAMQITVVTTYGSSETSGGCVYDGTPLPGAQVEVDPDGRIHLGGPMIAHGYRNMPGHEAFARPGWFATSDGGRLDGGKLTVTGRLDAVIDSGGMKLHPEVLEREMLQVPGVSEACVVGVPHERFGQAIVAAYVGEAEVGDVLDGLAHLPRWQIPKDIRRVTQLPLIGPGKVDRQGVVKLFNARP